MGNGTLLAVDDNPHNLQLLSGILQGAGYTVRAANSGARALRILERDAPDLVLLDVEMPELDGYAVCREIRSRPALDGVPVIFVSALDDVAAKVRGFAAGGVDYVSKPFEAAEVLARVETHLAILRLRRELERRNEELRATITQLERAQRALADLAYLDPLTGVPNRRSFDELLEREWRRAAREGRSIALAMLDVDCFKALNDTYGHATGDACLQRVAAAMNAQLRRPGDVLARYGGEEFVLVLPGSDAPGATATAEALRSAVAALAIPNERAPLGQVTISAGVAAERPAATTAAAELLGRADAALYAAKQAGRNRVGAG